MIETKPMKRIKTASFLFLFVLNFHCFGFSIDSSNQQVPIDTVKAWTFNNLNMLSVNQMAFVNWAAGGESSISGLISTEYTLKYEKRKFTFNHNGNLAYGLVGYKDRRIEKTDDKINLLVAFSHKLNKKWDYTGLITFKTQFDEGYAYPDDSTLISTFMAPAYLTVSLGMNYKPIKDFQLFLSPISGKMTFVLNDELANKGAFGVRKAELDSLGNVIVPGKKLFSQLGLNLLTSYKAKLMKNIDVKTALNLYNNYLDTDHANRWNIDLDWDTRVVFTINKIFSTILYFHMKYDHNAKIPVYAIEDGEKVKVSESPKLQLKESFGLSVTYRIE